MSTVLNGANVEFNNVSYSHICKNFFIENNSFFTQMKFNGNDRILFCGDDTPGWVDIPLKQALYHIETMLKNEAYFNWSYKVVEGKILIQTGKRTKIEAIEFNNFPGHELQEVSYKAVIGEPMTPKMLNEVTSWTARRLRAIGYPCPQINIDAIYKQSKIQVNIEKGPLVYVSKIDRGLPVGINPKALSRFDAISEGQLYNGDYFDLTSRRLIASGVASYSYFSNSCNSLLEGTEYEQSLSTVKQKILLDKPYALTMAIGASTEELPIIKVNWLHTRLNRNASSLFSELYASPLRQSFMTELNLYFFNNLPRLYFFPNIEIERIAEDVYTALFQRYKMGTGYTYDSVNHRFQTRVAPTFNIEKTYEGTRIDTLHYLSINSSLNMSTHFFEYFKFSPRTGYQLNFDWIIKEDESVTKLNSSEFQLAGHYLKNFGSYDPPIVILGMRFKLATLSLNNIEDSPQSFRLYLGGDDDIRGFSRKSINNDNKGYISTAYLGFEGRFTSLLPYKLQPFLLFDLAKIGFQTLQYAKPVFYSPGIGMRWESFIGTFRATAARGIIKNNIPSSTINTVEGWNYFLSYGRSF